MVELGRVSYEFLGFVNLGKGKPWEANTYYHQTSSKNVKRHPIVSYSISLYISNNVGYNMFESIGYH